MQCLRASHHYLHATCPITKPRPDLTLVITITRTLIPIPVSTAAECNIANSNKAAGTYCKCSPGFKGTITWSGATPSGTCTRTQCTGPNANAPANGGVSKSDLDNHGSKATFTCKDGFRVDGANPITCAAKSADAAWPSPPQCTGTLVAISSAKDKLIRKRSPTIA